MRKTERTRVALVIDPRFSGGTSSAVAHEIRTIAGHVDLSVHALETKMFKGRKPNPKLQEALDEVGIEMTWNDAAIRAEIVVLHNPSCLKFNDDLQTRILCDRLIVVTHENFLRPDGVSEGFDIAKCLDLVADATVCKARFLAPVSGYNRRGVEAWQKTSRRFWKLANFDWFNICDFEMSEPTPEPRDRRGRLSRAGYEKFPAMEVMRRHFPAHAEACRILGGDSFLVDPSSIPAHWTVLPFGAMPVGEFLEGLDFFVYYTHPRWRESFGRVIAEAICAGKVVITDPGTAEIFGEAVVASDGEDVDAIIAGFVANPNSYVRFVRRAQHIVAGFSSESFIRKVLAGARKTQGENHDLL
ncbi:glycosyltransferase [Defluviimonas salinarum]|uniref:Glycosyltransferase n=1 Tax=Defluviimonas salinarum TaxID=2992147 RepID=A0ABT3J495_9RHOB|nr:glycosyltransferase [Defluviimonas salinarum]MCW3782493.1 glycosyltransferase [Defluviimonas salinarum]